MLGGELGDFATTIRFPSYPNWGLVRPQDTEYRVELRGADFMSLGSSTMKVTAHDSNTGKTYSKVFEPQQFPINMWGGFDNICRKPEGKMCPGTQISSAGI